MSDTENKKENNNSAEEAFMTANAEDESIDEELLALSAPPPSPQHAIFILIILGFSCLVLYLFWPELTYFVKGFSDPTRLGEAADLESKQLASDSYVQVEGVPLVNRTVTFSTGTKWFSGDIYRKMAPLSGNPNLLVQWHTHNPNIKQAKDELTPPSDFAGRLKKRSDLSENYNKFWPFYDCLKLHSTSQCKFCIGKNDLDACRPIFTCVDNYPIEVCDHTAFFTKEQVSEKIQKLKADIQSRASADLAAELEMNEKALAAFDNIDVLSDFVLLEELFDRLGQLNLPDDARGDAFALQKQIFDTQVRALEIRLQTPLAKIDGLSGALKNKLAQAQQSLHAAEIDISALEAQQSKLGPLVDVYNELTEFVALVKELQEKLRRFDDDSKSLEKWSLTGEETGAELLAKVRDLSALIATLKLTPKPQATAESVAADTDSDAADTDGATLDAGEVATAVETGAADTDAVSGEETGATVAGKPSVDAENAAAPLADSILARIDGQLNQATQRVAQLGRKMIAIAPGDVPELDTWAKSTDIVGTLPKPLRADHVFKAFEKLLKMTDGFEPHETESLKTRYKKISASLKEKRKAVTTLKATSGLAELRLVTEFRTLQNVQSAVKDESSLKVAVTEWRKLTGAYVREEFYPWDLSNYPKEKAALAGLIQKADLPALQTRVKQFEDRYATPMYVLLDDEKPTDNPWILFVYIIVPIMIFINFRKLLRFIAEWRQ
ncbi:MAG: hypothetical protein JXX29_01155 [Deltaproteobacteria bacterium]|nr:hypothetical protein [Deltaproteobacteria bacterium]MBN2670246.1 hypothetical protein [Deltaproteobacteria bacterium]